MAPQLLNWAPAGPKGGGVRIVEPLKCRPPKGGGSTSLPLGMDGDLPPNSTYDVGLMGCLLGMLQ